MVVRFNPDGYTAATGRKAPSLFKYHATIGVPIVRKEAEWDVRRERLLEVVRGHVSRGVRDGAPAREITVDNLFFDGCE